MRKALTIVFAGLFGAATAAALFNPVPVARFDSAPPPTANPRSSRTLTATVISMEDKGRSVFVLNVTSSRTDAVIENCQWRQIAGDDLHLNEVYLQRPQFGLRIHQPGTYLFEVAATYSDGVQERAQVALPVVEAVSLRSDPTYMVYGMRRTELLTSSPSAAK